MSRESCKMAGALLVILPTVMFGGGSLLYLLITPESGHAENPLRQDLFRAGHAHAGVFLVLSLLCLRYVDEASLSSGSKWEVRICVLSAAILVPAAFFFSVVRPDATESNVFIYLAPVGAISPALGLGTLGVGLLRSSEAT